MEAFVGFSQSIISFIVIISVIVFAHEFGHYLVARLSGVRIKVFSIGFGKEIFGWNDKHGTRWKISLLPLGGYVQMFGDASEASTADTGALEKMTAEERKEAFHFKPLPVKAAIVAAGPVANFIFSIVVLAVLYTFIGRMYAPPVVGDLVEGGLAAEVGLQADDRILSIDGEEMHGFGDIQQKVMMNPGREMLFIIDRAGSRLEFLITPRKAEKENVFGETQEVGLLGIYSPEMAYEELNFGQAVVEAGSETYKIASNLPVLLGEIIVGQRSVEQLSGPVGIANYSGKATEKGLTFTLWFMAMLSISLGVLNILPIPPLDGGHLLYYTIEAIWRRPLAEKYQMFGFRVGFALLIMLMLVTTTNDILRLF